MSMWHGIGLSLFEMPALAALVNAVVNEDRARIKVRIAAEAPA